jgi:uncharacterized protein
MKKQQILQLLRNYKLSHAERLKIQALGVFGSVARDMAEEGSDVDIVLRISEPDLFLLVGIKNDLENLFHRKVDIVTYRENMNTFLKRRIDKEAVYV